MEKVLESWRVVVVEKDQNRVQVVVCLVEPRYYNAQGPWSLPARGKLHKC